MLARFLALCGLAAVSSIAYAIQADPVWRETAIRHARPRAAGEKFDPQESDPKLREAFTAADAAAERRVANVKRDEKFIFHFWSAKKDVLRHKYGIDWKSPAELNPQIAYASYGQPQITQREIDEITPVIRKRTVRPITTIERDLDGKITVWTKPDGNEAKTYTVRKTHSSWKVIHEDVAIFD